MKNIFSKFSANRELPPKPSLAFFCRQAGRPAGRVTSYKLRVTRDERGFIALISVMIIGILALLIAVNLSSRSVGEAYMGFDDQEAHRSLALAETCAEKALASLKISLTYPGNETVSIGDYTCQILPVEGTGNANRTIKTQSLASGYAKRIKIEIAQVNPSLQITSWQEVSGF